MPLFWLFASVLAIAVVGFVFVRQRALSSAGGDVRSLHSLPNYYGWNVVMKVTVPAFGVMAVWLIVQPMVLQSSIAGMIPESEIKEGSNMGLVMAEVRRTASGIENAVATGVMSDALARDTNADSAAVTQLLKDAGQVVPVMCPSRF